MVTYQLSISVHLFTRKPLRESLIDIALLALLVLRLSFVPAQRKVDLLRSDWFPHKDMGDTNQF